LNKYFIKIKNGRIAHELGTYESVLQKEFPKAIREEYVRRDPLKILSNFFVKTHKILTSRKS